MAQEHREEVIKIIKEIEDLERSTRANRLKREIEDTMEEITDTETALEVLKRTLRDKLDSHMELTGYKGWGEYEDYLR